MQFSLIFLDVQIREEKNGIHQNLIFHQFFLSPSFSFSSRGDYNHCTRKKSITGFVNNVFFFAFYRHIFKPFDNTYICIYIYIYIYMGLKIKQISKYLFPCPWYLLVQ